ncbi:hypothetical protein MASR2M48_07450 [Spirochaetota bacterium]
MEIEEERYKALSCDIRRKAEAAVLAYANAAFKRDIALKALSLAESMSELVATQIRLGQALRNAAIEAELSRSEKEIDLIDAVTFLAAAERNIESLLDILPGSLALFLENMPTNSSDEGRTAGAKKAVLEPAHGKAMLALPYKYQRRNTYNHSAGFMP